MAVKHPSKLQMREMHSWVFFFTITIIYYCLNSSWPPTFLLRPLWMPVMVSRRSPRLVRRGKGELGDIIPGRSLHPGQAKPGRLAVVSGAMWHTWALHNTEEDLTQQRKQCEDDRHVEKLSSRLRHTYLRFFSRSSMTWWDSKGRRRSAVSSSSSWRVSTGLKQLCWAAAWHLC